MADPDQQQQQPPAEPAREPQPADLVQASQDAAGAMQPGMTPEQARQAMSEVLDEKLGAFTIPEQQRQQMANDAAAATISQLEARGAFEHGTLEGDQETPTSDEPETPPDEPADVEPRQTSWAERFLGH